MTAPTPEWSAAGKPAGEWDKIRRLAPKTKPDEAVLGSRWARAGRTGESAA